MKTILPGERELTTGLLSKDANFRLVVSGPIGVKEIERLIQKLELDKEILADQGQDANEEPARRSIPRIQSTRRTGEDEEAAN